jgi:phosphoribosylpyrophosphate synthetase
MVYLLEKIEQPVQTEEPNWTPEVPEWEESVSRESQGWQARQLWERMMLPHAELARESSALLATGIGGGVAGSIESNGVSRFGDGSLVYPYVDLGERFGQVPKVLFALASTPGSDQLTNLITAAMEYKEQGVEVFIPILTAFPHERQDHKFTSGGGSKINQLTTLKGAVATLAGASKLGYIDGAMVIGSHSLRPVELALREDFPLLPFDPFPYMVKAAGLAEVENPFVVGPDKGRRNEARRLAAWLKAPYVTGRKTRDRLVDNEPKIMIDPGALDYIRQYHCTAVTYDDEIREAGSIGDLRREVDGWASGLVVVATKGYFANGKKGGQPISAAERLNQALKYGFRQERIIVSNAVEPLDAGALWPIEDRLVWIDLGPGIARMVERLKVNLVGGDDPDWMRVNGADLHLDLTHEQYAQAGE